MTERLNHTELEQLDVRVQVHLAHAIAVHPECASFAVEVDSRTGEGRLEGAPLTTERGCECQSRHDNVLSFVSRPDCGRSSLSIPGIREEMAERARTVH